MARKDHEQYLFYLYQLYRLAGVMPDISLLAGHEPTAVPIWALDPKHSERSNYGFRDYEITPSHIATLSGRGYGAITSLPVLGELHHQYCRI